MIFVGEWEQDSRIIHSEEWLCLSITVKQQRSGPVAALIEPHRATLRLLKQSIYRRAGTTYSLVTYSCRKAAFWKSNKRAELSLTGTLRWFCDILCEAWTIVIIFYYFWSPLLLPARWGNLLKQLVIIDQRLRCWDLSKPDKILHCETNTSGGFDCTNAEAKILHSHSFVMT